MFFQNEYYPTKKSLLLDESIPLLRLLEFWEAQLHLQNESQSALSQQQFARCDLLASLLMQSHNERCSPSSHHKSYIFSNSNRGQLLTYSNGHHSINDASDLTYQVMTNKNLKVDHPKLQYLLPQKAHPVRAN